MMRAGLVAAETVNGLRRNPAMTVAVVVTVAISLALLGSGLLVRAQVTAMKGYWYDKVEVSVFLAKTVDEPQRKQIKKELQAIPVVTNVFYESKSQAYERFSNQFKESPELVRNISPTALPESYRVKLTNPTRFADVAIALENTPGVGQVVDQRKLLSKFFVVLNGIQSTALGLAIVLVAAATVLIAFIVRLSVISRRREVSVMRLVGATGFAIRLPFLLQAAIAGTAGTGLAVTILAAGKHYYIDGQLKGIYPETAFVGWPQVWQATILLVVLGAMLPTFAASVSLRRHLRK